MLTLTLQVARVATFQELAKKQNYNGFSFLQILELITFIMMIPASALRCYGVQCKEIDR